MPLLQSFTGIGRHYSAGEWRDGQMDDLQAYGAIGTTIDVAIKIGRQAGYLNL